MLLEDIGRKHGWTPRRAEVSPGRLATLARWRLIDATKYLPDIGPLPDEDEDVDEHEHERTPDPLTEAAALEPGAVDVDTERVIAAEGLDVDEAAAMTAAMAGWGGALAYAEATGIHSSTARKRIERGKAKLHRRYPEPADLLRMLVNLDASAIVHEDERPRVRWTVRDGRVWTAVSAADLPMPLRERPRLDAKARAARRALEAVAPTTPAPHGVKCDREPRDEDGQERPVGTVPPFPEKLGSGRRTAALVRYLARYAERAPADGLPGLPVADLPTWPVREPVPVDVDGAAVRCWERDVAREARKLAEARYPSRQDRGRAVTSYLAEAPRLAEAMTG